MQPTAYSDRMRLKSGLWVTLRTIGQQLFAVTIEPLRRACLLIPDRNRARRLVATEAHKLGISFDGVRCSVPIDRADSLHVLMLDLAGAAR
jgi:hypothetical protein